MTAHFKMIGLLVGVTFLNAFAPDTKVPDAPFKATLPVESAFAPKQQLSEYAFFLDSLNLLKPAENVFPYEVNAPLFSDYAEKARFIYLPEGAKMEFRESGTFEFSAGACIIKNFFYWNDAAQPEKGRRIIETRLLLKDEKGWKALEYIWNTEQTDAFLEVAGGSTPVSWLNADGKKQDFSYFIPNLNQCKGCHSYDGKFTPIGITVKQMNLDVRENVNQLQAFQKAGKLDLPEGFEPENVAHLTDYRKNKQPAAAARSYLDANCAHCHNPHGPASTSGMFLNVEETNPEHLGINKTPVAAGRGSGNRKYGIVPGKPSESILLYRMESNDPGIRMPELGRQVMHEEGVALIREWIRGM